MSAWHREPLLYQYLKPLFSYRAWWEGSCSSHNLFWKQGSSHLRFLLLSLHFLGLKDTTGSESDGGDSCSTKSEGANGGTTIQPKKVKGVGFGDIFKDKPIKLRPRSIEVDNDFVTVDKVRIIS